MEHQVLRGDARLQAPREDEPDRLGHLHERQARVDQRRVLRGAHAVGERVVPAAHARVAVGGLDEVAGVDDLLARHLVADARRDAVLRAEVAHAGVLLERPLHVAQRLDLGRVGRHRGHAVRVDHVVLEHGELRRVLDAVVLAVLLAQELVHLRGRELVAVAAVHVADDRVARLHVVHAPRRPLRRPARCAARIFSAIVIGRWPVPVARDRHLALGERLAEREEAARAHDRAA